MICSRFPYSIYYLKSGMDVDVYAVLDDRRDPKRTDELLSRIGSQ